jgi:hypothetical protein
VHPRAAAEAGFGIARLLPRLRELRRRSAEYRPNLPALHMRIGVDSVRLTEDCARLGGGA